MNRRDTFAPPGSASVPETELLSRIRAGSAYPWLYPTPDFQNFDKFGAVALPAVSASAVIGDGSLGNGNTLPFKVPKGFNGFIRAIAFEFVANGGDAFTPGIVPAQLSFTLSINSVPAPDYGTVVYSPGMIASPTPVAGIPIKEGNTVQVLVSNISIVVTTQFVMARLLGYYYGKQLEPRTLAF